MFTHLLVPVDGGEFSDATVKRACSFAKEAGAKITFYHAVPAFFPPLMAGEGVIVDMGANEVFHEGMIKRATDLLSAACVEATSMAVEHQSVQSESDSPYEGIIACAEKCQCDLIFMSSHGRRGMRALLLGSETQKVLTHCKIPVLVFR